MKNTGILTGLEEAVENIYKTKNKPPAQYIEGITFTMNESGAIDVKPQSIVNIKPVKSNTNKIQGDLEFNDIEINGEFHSIITSLPPPNTYIGANTSKHQDEKIFNNFIKLKAMKKPNRNK